MLELNALLFHILFDRSTISYSYQCADVSQRPKHTVVLHFTPIDLVCIRTKRLNVNYWYHEILNMKYLYLNIPRAARTAQQEPSGARPAAGAFKNLL